ncbi:hypothetical protein [Alloscardovia macacae]|uniref:Uncharacterized protein n=2 Tax=Alloscardovia macacae TaxID=1160091 RepID=A0A261F4N0_9BIFI|nr:hypothetical protein [Alloscardovia macacae]OZG54099.1 hypothetical protein ALMA_0560 [Alloscardovia macacae]
MIMDVQSLSGIVIGTLVLIVLVGVVPCATLLSQWNATRHHEDRYSTSLHIVEDESEATRDVHRKTRRERERVARRNAQRFSHRNVQHMRATRRAGARRRRALCIALLLAAGVTAGCAAVFHFSFWFMSIPLVLCVLILLQGAVYSARVRQWERELKAYRARQSMVSRAGVTSFNAQLASSRLRVEAEQGSGESLFAIDDTQTVQFRRLPAESSTDDEVRSRAIQSVKQVSVAVPPSYEVRIPKSDADAEAQVDELVDA